MSGRGQRGTQEARPSLRTEATGGPTPRPARSQPAGQWSEPPRPTRLLGLELRPSRPARGSRDGGGAGVLLPLGPEGALRAAGSSPSFTTRLAGTRLAPISSSCLFRAAWQPLCKTTFCRSLRRGDTRPPRPRRQPLLPGEQAGPHPAWSTHWGPCLVRASWESPPVSATAAARDPPQHLSRGLGLVGAGPGGGPSRVGPALGSLALGGRLWARKPAPPAMPGPPCSCPSGSVVGRPPWTRGGCRAPGVAAQGSRLVGRQLILKRCPPSSA